MKLFVYYKMIASEYPALQIKIQMMQAELRSQFSTLSSDLLKRPDPDESGRETWMEIYHLSDIDINTFRIELDLLARNAQLPQPRRNEVFISI